MSTAEVPTTHQAQQSADQEAESAHVENHRSQHTGWLRAAVLGANDGIVSTASIMIGVASAHAPHNEVLITGIAGLVAGAMSMAAGEYVSVQSQADTEHADLAMERRNISVDHRAEQDELTGIYIRRGLKPELAQEVSKQLMAHDALGAHARDELGINDKMKARPVQAAAASAASFTLGAAMPVATAALFATDTIPLIAASSLVFLTVLGAIAAYIGGAPVIKGALRVLFWGALAMALTAAVGQMFGVAA
jgi:VIT1/CCC1 family predicted Fe2+/Mn2+ transporter